MIKKTKTILLSALTASTCGLTTTGLAMCMTSCSKKGRDISLSDDKSTITITKNNQDGIECTVKAVDSSKYVSSVSIQIGDQTLSDTDYSYSSTSGTIVISKDTLSKYSGNIIITPTLRAKEPSVTKVTSIVLNDGQTKSMVKGAIDVLLPISVLPENATDKSVKWSTSDATKVSIDEATGKMKAEDITTNPVTIKATANDGSGVYGECQVSVINNDNPVTSITLNGGTATKDIAKGSTDIKLACKVLPENATDPSVTWSSSDVTKISIDSNTGIMNAKEKTDSPVTIRATANDGSGKYGECKVNVTSAIDQITLNKTSLAVFPDITTQKSAGVIATLSYENAGDPITWSITQGEDLVKLQSTTTYSGETQTITGLAPGTATITATAGGKTATCTVNVAYSVTVVDNDGNEYQNIQNLYNSSGNISGTKVGGTETFNVARTSFNYQIKFNSVLTSIPDELLHGCTSFNQQINIPSSVNSIGSYFLYQCSAFNNGSDGTTSNDLALPTGLTTVPPYFLNKCSAFNQKIIIPTGVTKIDTYFLTDCVVFNSALSLPNTITEIGGYFLSGCRLFNKTVTLPTQLTSLGARFLGGCGYFNNGSDGTTDVPLNIPSGVTAINEGFLYNCGSLTQLINFQGNITTIGNNFLYNARAFNRTLILPNSVTSIGTSFMPNCVSFNNGSDGTTNIPFNIPSGVTVINNSFLSSCDKFNQTITLPSGITSIGNGFLKSCDVFNKQLTLPSSLTSIGDEFLYDNEVYNQQITIPSTVTSIGSKFLAMYDPNKSPFANVIDFSSISSPNSFTIGDNLLYQVPEANTIIFKVASGTTADWQTKLLTATGKSTWPSTWTFTEA